MSSLAVLSCTPVKPIWMSIIVSEINVICEIINELGPKGTEKIPYSTQNQMNPHYAKDLKMDHRMKLCSEGVKGSARLIKAFSREHNLHCKLMGMGCTD
ncbi:3-isopropylmalate dehydratase large subunit [Frankliniella fusca]|uniref:3-isopropylmalate dehydratase large subunit n=1 Tax=Frankliniella fusca TaxID=407009 RepID=A0AAE1HQS2_9NEOP|nr:3-isopropylmalate dehydratase large subunit [Frankliniella fusca]